MPKISTRRDQIKVIEENHLIEDKFMDQILDEVAELIYREYCQFQRIIKSKKQMGYSSQIKEDIA